MPTEYLSQAKVLLVDDEPANVRLLERILMISGCLKLQATTDSRQALPMFLEFEPDIVLLDLNMPYLNGFAVLDQLRQATSSDDYLPILILTADITVETKRRALAGGANDFLTKPLDQSEVVLRMKNLIENRFLRQAMQRQNLLLEAQVRERTAQLEETLNELQSTQEQIVKQERLRALGMMAGGIAHDFNNALTMVLGYGELLQPWLEQHGTSRELAHLDHMVSAARDATHVVSRLREFYRPAENNEIRTPVDLSQVANQVVSLTSPKWKGKCQAEGIQIEVITQLLQVPPIAGDAAALREVLTNLVFNAVDAMPQGGTLTVSTQELDETVIITVSDTGIGMTDRERERCLEPFFTTKGDQGTGLGLSVVYGIVQRHGGKIEIASKKGVGTSLSIHFPITATVATPEALEVVRLNRSLRVLVVDDQEVICELLTEYLQSDGHTTASAFRGDAALEVFCGDTFDLIITDQSMPGMNGVQLAGAVKAHAPETLVILLTGFGDEMMASGDTPPGVDVVLGKPVSHADLSKAIMRAFSGQLPLASVA